jgi:hypothetical protein
MAQKTGAGKVISSLQNYVIIEFQDHEMAMGGGVLVQLRTRPSPRVCLNAFAPELCSGHGAAWPGLP